jgi:hypothetical protein
VDESLNTLRYAQRSRCITNTIHQNVIDATNPAHVTTLLAENKMLKARILSMKRQHDELESGSVRTSQRIGSGSTVFSHQETGPDFSDIRAKLRLAEEEAKVTRAYCESIKSQTEKIKDRYRTISGNTAEVSFVAI